MGKKNKSNKKSDIVDNSTPDIKENQNIEDCTCIDILNTENIVAEVDSNVSTVSKSEEYSSDESYSGEYSINPNYKNDSEFFSEINDSNDIRLSKMDRESIKMSVLEKLVESHLELVSIFKQLNSL